ncbi:hypothetical protein ASE23_20425 [Rhizobium sp. Root73]|nr:hypothetical protein ASE23_20425 [Rhizobium sp. Root73]
MKRIEKIESALVQKNCQKEKNESSHKAEADGFLGKIEILLIYFNLLIEADVFCIVAAMNCATCLIRRQGEKN